MVNSTRALISLLLVFFLFTVCESADSGMENPALSPLTIHPLANLTRQTLFLASRPSLSAGSDDITPQTLRLAYGIDSLVQRGFTGKGQTIIDPVNLGNPTIQQDMKVFDQRFNLPPIDLQVISPLNIPQQASRQDKAEAAHETELDVEAIHAIAPDAKVIVLQSPIGLSQEKDIGEDAFQLEQYIITHQLGYIVSHSWSESELALQNVEGQQELQQWNSLLQQGTINYHITYFSASGDLGATDTKDDQGNLANVPETNFAADSPWVTGVGGTTLKLVNSTYHETAWSGSGGGFSRFYQMPFYQKMLPAAVQKQFDNQRGVPDVSAVSSSLMGLPVYVSGRWMSGGGTSLSTPIWAAIGAIANQMAGHPLGFINPGLYKLAISPTYRQDFHDITQGNNDNQQAGVKGYSAVAGWDAVTGLGTPNAEKLIPDLIAALGSTPAGAQPITTPAQVN